MQVLLAEQSLATTLAVAGGVIEKRKIVDEIQDILKTQTQAQTATDATLGIDSCHKPLHTHTPFPGISQLLPHLFLCGAGVAMPQILDQLGVTFVINVAPELPDTPLSSATNPLYLRVNALDRPDVDLAQHFDEVADLIEQVHQHGGKALVHCVAGVSRSASLCLAYLIKHGNLSLREAYLHVKSIRPQIRPNSGFFEQLRAYEERLRGTCTVRLVFYESLNKEIPDVYEPEYRAMEEFYQRQRNMLRQRHLQRTSAQQTAALEASNAQVEAPAPAPAPTPTPPPQVEPQTA